MKKIPYNYDNLAKATAKSKSYSDLLRNMGRAVASGNYATIKKKIRELDIDTSHFDPYYRAKGRSGSKATPLEEILVKDSSYTNINSLKKRLFAAGLLTHECSICGQGEMWRGKRMSLILDHINGVNNDHRIENLRLVCPNCNATLDTHCGRNIQGAHKPPPMKPCRECGQDFQPTKKNPNRKYCSAKCHSKVRSRDCSQRFGHNDQACLVCGSTNKQNQNNKTCSRECHRKLISKNASARQKGVARPQDRKVERPPYKKLITEVEKNGYSATGRKYGVSDNAIRKWIKFYENQ